MASTTPNKKAIIDFLWEWAESHGQWSKLLISNIVRTECSLSSTDRKNIFDYFLQSISLHSGLPTLTLAKPTYTPTSKQIELESLSDITGVNRLAKNQTINFAKDITIIYGENGTGKTGYSRILKTLGFSYDHNNNILTNIFGPTEPQAATIKFKTNGIAKEFSWNGRNSDPELENISVFNSNCVQISISDRLLIVSPIGFHLFNLVSEELNELSRLLNEKIGLHPIMLTCLENLTIGTPQQIFIAGLSKASTEQKLIELSTFSTEQECELTAKVMQLANLNKTLLQTEIQNMSTSVLELETLIGKIKTASTQFTTLKWQALIDLNKEIVELESKTRKGIKDIAEQNGINFYDTEEFKSFIKAAEDYIRIIDKPDYPSPEDICVYCLQPLEDPARELLTSYHILLNDKTQEKLNVLGKRKADLIWQVTQIETNLTFHQPTFGVDEYQKAVQPKEITVYNENLGELKLTFTTDKVDKDSTFTFDYQNVLEFFIGKRDDISSTLDQRAYTLRNLEGNEIQLKKQIADLRDRKLLSSKVSEVKTAIANHKIVNTLSMNAVSFNTTAISRKTSTARQELIQQNFEDIFKKELKSLRKSNLIIDLNFETERGSSKVIQKISNHVLAEILSEGEQKAIALAEFLTELQLDNIKAPVIFDDPVNSLDHRIIDEVVKRLIELSTLRQVVVFTHSILLLHSFIQQSELEHYKQAGIQFLFHRVKENFGMTGVLDEVEEINSFGYYTKKLNLVLQTKPEGQDEAKLAAEGYGHLRSAIEISVEDDLFKKTIKRYKKGVAFPSLLRVEGGKIDIHKGGLNNIYEKCCVSIDGHSGPEEVPTTPTMAALRIDFEEFKRIRSNFTTS